MIKYKLFPEKNLISVLFDKTVTYEEIQKFHLDIANETEYKPSFNGVVDERTATINLTPDQLEEIANLNKREKLVLGKWAHLVYTPIETALADIYSDLAEEEHPVGYFSTIEATSLFLEIDVKPYLFNTSITDNE